jgi:hypothetical protein
MIILFTLLMDSNWLHHYDLDARTYFLPSMVASGQSAYFLTTDLREVYRLDVAQDSQATLFFRASEKASLLGNLTATDRAILFIEFFEDFSQPALLHSFAIGERKWKRTELSTAIPFAMAMVDEELLFSFRFPFLGNDPSLFEQDNMEVLEDIALRRFMTLNLEDGSWNPYFPSLAPLVASRLPAILGENWRNQSIYEMASDGEILVLFDQRAGEIGLCTSREGVPLRISIEPVEGESKAIHDVAVIKKQIWVSTNWPSPTLRVYDLQGQLLEETPCKVPLWALASSEGKLIVSHSFGIDVFRLKE